MRNATHMRSTLFDNSGRSSTLAQSFPKFDRSTNTRSRRGLPALASLSQRFNRDSPRSIEIIRFYFFDTGIIKEDNVIDVFLALRHLNIATL